MGDLEEHLLTISLTPSVDPVSLYSSGNFTFVDNRPECTYDGGDNSRFESIQILIVDRIYTRVGETWNVCLLTSGK